MTTPPSPAEPPGDNPRELSERDSLRVLALPKFVADKIGQQHATEQLRQNLNDTDQNQIVRRPGVRNH